MAANGFGAKHWRNRVSTALMAITFVLASIAGPALYVSTVIVDEDAFVSVADEVLAHPETQQVVAEAATTVAIEVITTDESITNALPESVRTFAVPFTSLATSQLTSGAFRVLDTPIAKEARDSALREVHRQFNADSDTIVIDLRAVLVRTGRELGGPAIGTGVAKVVANSDTGRYVLAEPGSPNSGLVTAVRAVPSVGAALAVAVLVSLIGAILIAVDRRRALVIGGFVLAGAALVSTVIVGVILYGVLAGVNGGSSVGTAVADVVSADYAEQQRGAIFFGLVMATIGLLLGNRPSAVAMRALPGDLWHRRSGAADRFAHVVSDNPALARSGSWSAGAFALATWSTPTWRVIITIAAAVVSVQFFVWIVTSARDSAARLRDRLGITTTDSTPSSTGRLRTNVAILTGLLFLVWPDWNETVVAAFLVVGAFTQALIDLPNAFRTGRHTNSSIEQVSPQGSRRRYAIAAVSLVAAGVTGFAATSGAAETVQDSKACNGHVELCDKRIDEVVFAGSHNSMSSTELGWELALQTGDIVSQLDYGIRALLIDALYWDNTGSLDGGPGEDTSAIIEAALSDDKPLPGTWLCHGFCALGATDLTSGLADINIWLDEHPREVLLIIVQDEVSAPDLENAFNASGLRTKAHIHKVGTPFPTLGELIDSGERILVYDENRGKPDTWLKNGYDATFTETPFTFAVRTEFSCAPNRGDPDNPLFLINHWVTTGIPVRQAAAVINSSDVLLERVRDCETERGRLPTIVATDFVQTGDLLEVVDELNGVAGTAE